MTVKQRYYCRVTSGYPSLDTTNLQVFSLQKAADTWNELRKDFADYDEIENIPRLVEKFAFVITCFGLSLSQLLGQNSPSNKDSMDQPGELLGNFLNKINLEREKKKSLNKEFSRFLEYYGALRHFGIIQSNKHHALIDELDAEKVIAFKQLTINIWDIVIDHYRQDDDNDIEQFDSIGNLISFDKWPKEP